MSGRSYRSSPAEDALTVPTRRLEEASLPNVVKAHNPYRLQSDLESNIGLKKGSGSIYIAAPDPTAPSLAVTDRHPYRPSEAWRKVFLSHFVDLREVSLIFDARVAVDLTPSSLRT